MECRVATNLVGGGKRPKGIQIVCKMNITSHNDKAIADWWLKSETMHWAC